MRMEKLQVSIYYLAVSPQVLFECKAHILDGVLRLSISYGSVSCLVLSFLFYALRELGYGGLGERSRVRCWPVDSITKTTGAHTKCLVNWMYALRLRGVQLDLCM